MCIYVSHLYFISVCRNTTYFTFSVIICIHSSWLSWYQLLCKHHTSAETLKGYRSWSRIHFTVHLQWRRQRGEGEWIWPWIFNFSVISFSLVCKRRPVWDSKLRSILLQVFIVCGDGHKLGKKRHLNQITIRMSSQFPNNGYVCIVCCITLYWYVGSSLFHGSGLLVLFQLNTWTEMNWESVIWIFCICHDGPEMAWHINKNKLNYTWRSHFILACKYLEVIRYHWELLYFICALIDYT